MRAQQCTLSGRLHLRKTVVPPTGRSRAQSGFARVPTSLAPLTDAPRGWRARPPTRRSGQRDDPATRACRSYVHEWSGRCGCIAGRPGWTAIAFSRRPHVPTVCVHERAVVSASGVWRLSVSRVLAGHLSSICCLTGGACSQSPRPGTAQRVPHPQSVGASRPLASRPSAVPSRRAPDHGDRRRLVEDIAHSGVFEFDARNWKLIRGLREGGWQRAVCDTSALRATASLILDAGARSGTVCKPTPDSQHRH